MTFSASNTAITATHASALGSGTIIYNTSTSGQQLTLASGVTTTWANNFSFASTASYTITLDAPSSQAGFTQTFGTAAFNQQSNLILNQTGNLTSTGTIAFGASTFGSPNTSKTSQLSPTGVNMTISSLTPIVSNNQTATLVLDGTSAGNTIGTIADGGSGATLNKAAITKQNTSTWTLAGTNTYTGTTTVSGGTLEIKSGASALTQTLGVLTLAGADVTLKSNLSLIHI